MFANYTGSATSRALIIADDALMQRVLQRILQQSGWEVDVYGSHKDWLASAEQNNWLFIVVCADSDCLRAVEALEEMQAEILAGRSFAVVVAKRPSIHDAIFCTQLGATDYLAWPVLPSQFLEIAERVRKQDQYGLSNERRPALDANHVEVWRQRGIERPMIGGSAAMIEFAKQMVRIARSPGMRAFITGETGTGKEIVARMMHEISECRGSFRAVNCAAAVEGLLESDLFGHEKGAFTGAHAMKRGFWEEAANGTLFLDEITEASLAVQAKLLRALQEGVIRRVGSNQEIKVTARVIAASNKDVEKAVKEGSFREDLFYRLGQVLRLPPLRERPEDIPLLAQHFARRFDKDAVIAPEAMEALCRYDWPGNVRELESVIQRIIAFTGRIVLREDVLRHFNAGETRDEALRHYLRTFWGALPEIKPDGWPTILELRDWYVRQIFYYLGRESAVARHVGLDVRTVNAILRKDEAWQEDLGEAPS